MEHSLALTTNGTVYAWGSNQYGQLGDGTTTDSHTPKAVTGLPKITQIAAGPQHSVALAEDGRVFAWGINVSGQLGDGTMTDRSRPVQAQNLTGVTQVATGAGHVLALTGDGTLFGWGAGRQGQNGVQDSTSVPTPTVLPATVKGISAGRVSSMAIMADGTVYGFGSNIFGELGELRRMSHFTPAEVYGLRGAVEISLGSTSLARTASGEVLRWCESGGFNEPGLWTCDLYPVWVVATSIEGGAAAMYITSENGLYSFGLHESWFYSSGVLGTGTTVRRPEPAAVLRPADLLAVPR
jgi:alpha-tubulin suppressor-like RCC1 family protein